MLYEDFESPEVSKRKSEKKLKNDKSKEKKHRKEEDDRGKGSGGITTTIPASAMIKTAYGMMPIWNAQPMMGYSMYP